MPGTAKCRPACAVLLRRPRVCVRPMAAVMPHARAAPADRAPWVFGGLLPSPPASPEMRRSASPARALFDLPRTLRRPASASMLRRMRKPCAGDVSPLPPPPRCRHSRPVSAPSAGRPKSAPPRTADEHRSARLRLTRARRHLSHAAFRSWRLAKSGRSPPPQDMGYGSGGSSTSSTSSGSSSGAEDATVAAADHRRRLCIARARVYGMMLVAKRRKQRAEAARQIVEGPAAIADASEPVVGILRRPRRPWTAVPPPRPPSLPLSSSPRPPHARGPGRRVRRRSVSFCAKVEVCDMDSWRTCCVPSK